MEEKKTYEASIKRLHEITEEIRREEDNILPLFGLVREAAAEIKNCKEKLFALDAEVQKAMEAIS
ncbi:MAG: exodeoxyribonuclease VII small subunit [Tannerella sp.]|jgi:exonuclease VII small subunit|nr:exodeoxyribonuclease VII small subunit [Tannerella sp.]